MCGKSSSVVTTHGPMDEAESLPLAGPSPKVISSNCKSRALQSLKMQKPAMYSIAADAGTLRPLLPMMQPISSS